MTHHLRYIHVHEPQQESDETVVRRCLLWFAQQEQARGEIPASVTEHELVQTLEQYVPKIVHALQHNPLYPELVTREQREQFITALLRELL